MGEEWINKGHNKISAEDLCNVGDFIFYFDIEIQPSNTTRSYEAIWFEDSNDSENSENKCPDVTSNGGIIRIAMGIVLLMILLLFGYFFFK